MTGRNISAQSRVELANNQNCSAIARAPGTIRASCLPLPPAEAQMPTAKDVGRGKPTLGKMSGKIKARILSNARI